MKTILLQLDGAGLGGLLITIVICLLIFLAIRALMLWYWRIDTIVLNQEKQLGALKAILARLTPSDQLTPEDKAKQFDAMIEAAKKREQAKI